MTKDRAVQVPLKYIQKLEDYVQANERYIKALDKMHDDDAPQNHSVVLDRLGTEFDRSRDRLFMYKWANSKNPFDE